MSLTKKAMLNRIKAVTNGFREVAPIKINDKDAKAKVLAEKLHKVWPNNVLVYELFEELTGYNLKNYIKSTDDNKIKFAKPLVCVVLTENTNNHNYPLNIPIIMFNWCRAVKPDGYVGNEVPYNSCYQSHIRLATDEEIDKLTDAQLEFMIRKYSL